MSTPQCSGLVLILLYSSSGLAWRPLRIQLRCAVIRSCEPLVPRAGDSLPELSPNAWATVLDELGKLAGGTEQSAALS